MENERKNKVEVSLDPEALILWIEECKRHTYKNTSIDDDRACNIAFGTQGAYDNVIHHIRELQGCFLK